MLSVVTFAKVRNFLQRATLCRTKIYLPSTISPKIVITTPFAAVQRRRNGVKTTVVAEKVCLTAKNVIGTVKSVSLTVSFSSRLLKNMIR